MDKHLFNTFSPIAYPFEMKGKNISCHSPAACHWHSNMEFYIVISGTLECLIHGQSIRLGTGESVFINCGALHMISNEGELSAKVFILQIPVDFGAGQRFPNQQLPTFMIFHPAEKVSRLLYWLSSTFQNGPHNTEYCFTLVEQILSEITHKVPNPSKSYFQSKSDHRQAETVKEILSYMHTHYPEKISIRELSRNLYIGQSEFFHGFKHFTNTTPIQYLNSFRLMKAEALLHDSQDSIYEISLACGFYSISYFGRMFRKKYRLSPTQYRKKAPLENPALHADGQSLQNICPA